MSDARSREESSSISQLQGVWAAAVTPWRESGHEIDLSSALEIIDYLNDQGLDGIALLGSTGEFVHFDVDERLRFVQMAIRRSRKPVIVNASHSTYQATLALATAALDAGAQSVLVMPPYFFRYRQTSIIEFFSQLGRDLRGSILLYNIPFFTTPMEAETAVRLLETGAFRGIKDSSGTPEFWNELAKLPNRQDLSLIVGNDVMYVRAAKSSIGVDGIISGVAAMAPELIVDLTRALREKDEAEISRLDALLTECLSWLDRFPTPVGVKLGVSYRGLKVGGVVPSFNDKEARLLGEYESWFRDWLPRIRT